MWINIKLLNSRNMFAQHLCEYFYRKNERFNDKIKKKEAKKILIDGVKWFGRNGEYLEAENIGTDNIDEYNSIFTEACNWVEKNYPELK